MSEREPSTIQELWRALPALIAQEVARVNAEQGSELEESWRFLPPYDREALARSLGEALDTRFADGYDMYGEYFQGDPLEHLLEELMDALFYVVVAQRRRQMEHGVE